MKFGSFSECSACSSKIGSPLLCPSCLRNRKKIEDLKRKLTPSTWTEEMHKTWQENLLDNHKAFKVLREMDV